MKEPRQVVARRGDVVAVTAHHVGESERIGEILEVLGDAEHPHFRVRWEDDRETIFYPSNDSVVRRSGR
jgi:rRNA processing protein Gar1